MTVTIVILVALLSVAVYSVYKQEIVLIKIEDLIFDYEINDTNPYTLIRNIKKELSIEDAQINNK